MRSPFSSRLVAAGLAAAQTWASWAGEPAGVRWTRTNYRGREVDLRGGVALWSGLMAGAFAADADPRSRAGAAFAVGASGAAGLADDLLGDSSAKGLRGHLGALREGKVTTGLIKIASIGAGAFASALLGAPRAHRAANVLVDTALIAGSANLVNLLDLRPGRALKAAALPAAALAAGPGGGATLASGVLGAEAAAARADLGERTMMGDCGANALGAAVGVAATRSLPLPAKIAAVAGLVGLTFASEKVSFSAVIARNPILARIDQWGRKG